MMTQLCHERAGLKKTILFQVDEIGTQVLVRDDKGTELLLLPFSLQKYLLIIPVISSKK